ncbi:hypothetical protein P7C70_g2302, partial [Phenoliferia sp. Uapishka_3]
MQHCPQQADGSACGPYTIFASLAVARHAMDELPVDQPFYFEWGQGQSTAQRHHDARKMRTEILSTLLHMRWQGDLTRRHGSLFESRPHQVNISPSREQLSERKRGNNFPLHRADLSSANVSRVGTAKFAAAAARLDVGRAVADQVFRDATEQASHRTPHHHPSEFRIYPPADLTFVLSSPRFVSCLFLFCFPEPAAPMPPPFTFSRPRPQATASSPSGKLIPTRAQDFSQVSALDSYSLYAHAPISTPNLGPDSAVADAEAEAQVDAEAEADADLEEEDPEGETETEEEPEAPVDADSPGDADSQADGDAGSDAESAGSDAATAALLGLEVWTGGDAQTTFQATIVSRKEPSVNIDMPPPLPTGRRSTRLKDGQEALELSQGSRATVPSAAVNARVKRLREVSTTLTKTPSTSLPAAPPARRPRLDPVRHPATASVVPSIVPQPRPPLPSTSVKVAAAKVKAKAKAKAKADVRPPAKAVSKKPKAPASQKALGSKRARSPDPSASPELEATISAPKRSRGRPRKPPDASSLSQVPKPAPKATSQSNPSTTAMQALALAQARVLVLELEAAESGQTRAILVANPR